MHLSGSARVTLRVVTAVVLVFVYLPLLVVVVNSFNPDRVATWPPDGFTVDWWTRAWDNPGARAALWTSVKAATGATVVALLLGTLLSFAVQRFRFFGRETLSLLVVLPIALPGIVTGIALQSAFRFLGVPLSLWTIVVGHATFCIVVVFNNTVARLRRMSRSLEEASMDLGADGAQTFRLVTFPALRTALLAGALLAFALSFDEIIVTTFTAGAGDQTLPIWIFTNLTRPNQAPVVNVVAVLLVLISVVPIWLAQRLSEGTVVISTSERRLYLVMPGNRALKYGIGVGRAGFEWAGTQTISRKAEWPDWVPPPEMLQRRPDLPRHMAGGPDNPLGARAMYLGGSLYRIHGSNEPETIGQAVSSGCIRMLNEDVVDLYERVKVGTKVVVLR